MKAKRTYLATFKSKLSTEWANQLRGWRDRMFHWGLRKPGHFQHSPSETNREVVAEMTTRGELEKQSKDTVAGAATVPGKCLSLIEPDDELQCFHVVLTVR